MSEKLDTALKAEIIDWDQVFRIFRRLRGIKHIHRYMCRIAPKCSLALLDTLMDHTSTKEYHSPNHLARMICLIWTRILTGNDSCHHEYLGEFSMGKDGEQIRQEWKTLLRQAHENWEEVDNKVRVPDIEQVVEALSKTARIVRSLPRPMNATPRAKMIKVSRQNNSKVRITDDPTMPLLHFFVFQNLPPIIIFIAATVYPEQLGQRDAWGNLPIHYANLSATEWTNWWSKPILNTDGMSSVPSAFPDININALMEEDTMKSLETVVPQKSRFNWKTRLSIEHLEESTSEDCQQVATNNSSFILSMKNLLHETSFPLLASIYPKGVRQRCQAGRLPLQTYLLSLLDYRRRFSNGWFWEAKDIGTSWHFIEEDLEQFLAIYPESVSILDPELECLPVQIPSLACWCRSETLKECTQPCQPTLHVTEGISEQALSRVGEGHGQPGRREELDNLRRQADKKQSPLPTNPMFDLVVVSLTYKLLRSYPRVIENANATTEDAALWSLYESQLYKRWKQRVATIEQLEQENQRLESKLASLLEKSH